MPNLTLGPPIVKSLRKHSTAFFDCHLMVAEPAKWVDAFAGAGANGFTFHAEAVHPDDQAELIQRIKSKGMKAGVALRPATPLDAIKDLVSLVDMVLIMTVEPGFGGQKMMPATLEKVRSLRITHPLLDIQVDGGIDLSNIHLVAQAGANIIVSGTGIFGSQDPQSTIQQFREIVNAVGAK